MSAGSEGELALHERMAANGKIFAPAVVRRETGSNGRSVVVAWSTTLTHLLPV